MRNTHAHGRGLSVGLAALFVSAALVGAPIAQAAETDQLTDLGITDAIEDELLFDGAVPQNRIMVSTIEGVVTLEGTVNNVMAKRRAVALASTVKGVRSVVDRIEVDPFWERTDIDIASDVREALINDPAAESWQVTTSVEDGVVTLEGTVDSWQERQLAEKVAAQVRGVRQVINLIDVDVQVDRSDYEIRTEIEEVLKWDALVDDALIDVSVENGAVTLVGTVGSLAEKNQARYDAWVAGVVSVDADGLEVQDWAAEPEVRSSEIVVRSDAEIRQAVEDALLYDPRVISTSVTPEVEAGHVTLRGTVQTLRARSAAAADARNTTGVVAVTNRLKVWPQIARSDDQLENAIEENLERDPFVERFEIDVTVVDGTAYLTGTVDNSFDKSRAEEAASTTLGVREVKNYITVREQDLPTVTTPLLSDYPLLDYHWYNYVPHYPSQNDLEIKQAIQNQMWWSPFVDADEVDVTVTNGVATLEGTVDSWRERSAATENAYEGGASLVRNQLDVE